MSHHPAPRWRRFLQEYSIPLLGGVVAALLAANLFEEAYEHWIEAPIAGLGLSLHFLVNDVFMVLFFGIAAKEITTSCLPGGDLNPFRKAINPLCGTLGGVYGPVLVFLGLVFVTGGWNTYAAGWGVPTATDIALAWLVARAVFGAKHPAVNYLLLLAVADDAIGLGIIAVAYPDLEHPTAPVYLALVVAAMGGAYLMRRRQVQHWAAYVLGPGVLSWWGLHAAHLHPALALVFVVPFMPGGTAPALAESATARAAHRPSTLDAFEHTLKVWVDFGLFFFAFANAGVAFSHVGPGTWYVFLALVVGKTLGVTAFGWLGTKIGFPLPAGMSMRHLFVAGMIAGLGLTVSLFVAGEAFEGVEQAEAKMGALLSILVAVFALVAGRALGVREPESLHSSDHASLAPAAFVEEQEGVLEEA
ncbi:MAG: Na+/H+ antiporter NhaA [Planctomycetota bacterium]